MAEIVLEKNNKTVEIGFSVLRLVMCFEVVLAHFWSQKGDLFVYRPFVLLRDTAVPIFMLLSFVLCEKYFSNITSSRVKSRMLRLIWPQVAWTFIYGISYLVFEKSVGVDVHITIKDIFWQLATGHSACLNVSMWYQIVLIILTVLTYIIYYSTNTEKSLVRILSALFILSLILQFSNVNFMIFNRFRYELRYTLGRIAEMVPYMVLGLLIAHYRLLDRARFHKKKAVSMLCVLLVVLGCTMLIPKAQGFGYSNITHMIIAIIMLFFVYIIPFNLLSNKIKDAISVVSKYTLGIYCVHRLIATMVIELFENAEIETGTFGMCVIIYILSYAVSWLISLVPCKVTRFIVQ